MSADTVNSAIGAACRVLEAAGVPFALIGGAALPAWGRIRATADADILLCMERGSSESEAGLVRLVGALRVEGFAHHDRADRKRVGGFLILHFWFPIRSQGVSVRLDLLCSDDASHREVLRRAVRRRIDGLTVPVASCEDLVLLKLRAGRPIDTADARALLAINRGELDGRYLESRAAALGLGDALAQAWRESDDTA
jgi:predicted nucleotidyltransferase